MMTKYLCKGSQGHVILSASSDLEAGSKALAYNLGAIHSIKVIDGKTKTTRRQGTRQQALPVLPWEFPFDLRA